MEIANLIISILSLAATIAISFVIYFLERHNQKITKEKEIKETAKRFIIDNADEIDYLTWATIAVGCFPQNKHVRKIYNAFSYLDDETKREVLRQRKLDCDLFYDDSWIQGKISLIVEAIHKLDLGDDFLYDSGKYLTRSYHYKKELIENLEHLKYTKACYDDIFNLGRSFLKHDKKLTYTQYLDDYLYCKFEKTELMPIDKDIKLPNDYLIETENLKTCQEDYLCYWMMVMVEEIIGYSIKHLNWEDDEHSETDAVPETYEDKYFHVLYELYYLKRK